MCPFYECHKINFKRGRSYIDSPDWIKNKIATINPINKKVNKCFQYAITVALNHKEIGKHPEGITKIKSFINKYNWDETNHPSEKMIGKILRKIIALDVLYAKKEKRYPVYISKYILNREK